MSSDERIRKLGEKYQRTPEQLAEDIVKMEEAKKKLTKNAVELEQNLKRFHEMSDPILDPSHPDEPLCWVRRPSTKEWEEMTPSELLEYKNVEEVPKEILDKYKNNIFNMMEKLITNPKHDAKWWRENTDLVFQEMFQVHLLDVYRKLGIMAGNF
jgi:hypothetical protein